MNRVREELLSYDKPSVTTYTEAELAASIESLGASGAGGGP